MTDFLKDLAALAAITLAVLAVTMLAYGIEPCEQEDSRNCYWNAQARGNGHGGR